MRRLLLAAAAVLVSAAASAAVNPITEAGLGFPVPVPIDSLTPVDGFRSRDSLNMRYADLALEHDHIERFKTGESLRGRDIHSFRFSSASPTTLEGIPKPAMMIQGTIHPREWQSLEVVAGIFEWLAESRESDPIAAYLIENAEIVVHPIGNPDGLYMTQSYHNQTVGGLSSGNWGSDGRMRRKNMRNGAGIVDEVLSTEGDASAGVDLNRNHEVGWPCFSCTSASGETYGGPSAGSEPESQALYAAAALLDETRIRFYIDFHSYSQLYYVMNTGSSSRNTLTARAYNLMKAVTLGTSGRTYSSTNVTIPGGAIGATDEYFAGTYGAMSYTCEIRPSGAGGDTPNGFILPESQIAETREELLASTRAGFYFAAGPPSLVGVELYDVTSGPNLPNAPVFAVRRGYSSGTGQRSTLVDSPGPIPGGRKYTIALRFNKPMRLQNGAAAEFFPGVTGSINPAVQLTGVTVASNYRWVFSGAGEPFGYLNYPGDTVLCDLSLLSLPNLSGDQQLQVAVADAAGQFLDADPATVVDWSPMGWTNYDTTKENFSINGGADRETIIAFGSPAQADVWVLY